jgi:tRNA threonylcarbamoyl adenosine modification protein YeaZ
MIAAAFETSTRSASVAISIPRAGAQQILTGTLDGGRAHASDLLPILATLLEQNGLTAAELDAVIVGIGPGSYTGLRVSVATALGLSLGELHGKTPDLLGVPSCEALLAEILQPGETGLWMQDARSGGFYIASGAVDADGSFAVHKEPAVVDREGLEAFLATAEGARLVGDGATAASLAKLGLNCVIEVHTPTAAGVLRLGLPRLASAGPTPPCELAPLYLRPFAVKVRKR